jgi:hypothetical protein
LITAGSRQPCPQYSLRALVTLLTTGVSLVLGSFTSSAAEPRQADDLGPVVGSVAARLDSLFPHASGVFLAEVTEISRHDERPTDGNLYDSIGLKFVRGTGRSLPSLYLVVARGGFSYDDLLMLSGMPVPKRPPPIYTLPPGRLRVGEQYWFVTAPEHEWESFPESVMGCWNADSAEAIAPLLEQAAATDAYCWHPDWSAEEKLTMGWRIEPSDSTSWIRMWRGKRMIWERHLPGLLNRDGYGAWAIRRGHDLGRYLRPPGLHNGVAALIEARVMLGPHNVYAIPPALWRIQFVLDATSGRTLGERMSRSDGGDVEVRYVAYDRALGTKRYERFQDRVPSGGHGVGARDESWLRRVECWLEPRNGRLLHARVSRWDAEDTWVPINYRLGMAAGPPGMSAAAK